MQAPEKHAAVRRLPSLRVVAHEAIGYSTASRRACLNPQARALGSAVELSVGHPYRVARQYVTLHNVVTTHFRAEDIEGKTITDALRTVQPLKWYGQGF